jgi:Domain of unknown function (DUF3427)/Helicase conserved C-terminal domain
MAARFEELGLAAVAVSGETRDDRRAAIRGLRNGKIHVIFSVDIFNEGVDVPSVDTVLMLRPSESPTIFLQQLGRGLRIARGKTLCTVLDFVGTHRREFRFDRRYRALLGGSRRDLERAVVDGFPFLPAGCHMELDRVARDVVLRNVRDAIPSQWPSKVEELRVLSSGHDAIPMATYLAETGLEVADIYANKHSWSELCEAAHLLTEPAGPHERALRRGTARLLHVDDHQRIDGYGRLLGSSSAPQVGAMSGLERRLTRMLVANLADPILARDTSIQSGIDMVWSHPQVLAELRELLDVLGNAPSHVQHQSLVDIPQQVHAQYTRIEILAAVNEGAGAKTPQWREGVYDAKTAGADLLVFTLDKTSGDFSPTTRYRDYAISPELIHWESQSTTRADSPTGQRYRNHVAMNRSILLFARTRADDRAFWFLGPATYVQHHGERPMAVTWKLATPLSGDLFAAFAAAVA